MFFASNKAFRLGPKENQPSNRPERRGMLERLKGHRPEVGLPDKTPRLVILNRFLFYLIQDSL